MDIFLESLELEATEIETAGDENVEGGGTGEYRADLGTVLVGIGKLGVQDPDPFGQGLDNIIDAEGERIYR